MARRGPGEGSIYFDADKDRWVGAISVGGKRRKVVAATKTAARQRLAELRRDVAGGAPAGSGNVTIGDVLDTWQRRALAGRDVAPATRQGYAWAVDKLTETIGSRRVRSFTADDLEAAYDTLAVDLGRASLVKLRQVLGQALDHGMRRGTVARNVARVADLTPDARREHERRALTADEAKRLMAALEGERLGALFLVTMTTGLRPGEAAGLCWDDVDFDRGRIAVRHAVRLEGGRAVLVDELKTERARRTITLPAVTVEALRRHRVAQRVERLAARRWSDDRLVFASEAGTPVDPARMRRELARISEAAGLGVVKPNELRHTAASLLSDAGVPLEHIADVLGHTSTRMLEQTYRHAVQPSITAAAAPMDAILG